MMRIAPAKAHALPSTIDERRAKIRKASLTTQKKSRDSSCSLSFSFCVFIAIISCSAARKPEAALIPAGQEAAEPHIGRPCNRLSLTTENQTKHETDPQRSKDRLRRVLANVLLAVVLKTADPMERGIRYPFRAAPIFIGHCARRRAEVVRRLPGVRRAPRVSL